MPWLLQRHTHAAPNVGRSRLSSPASDAAPPTTTDTADATMADAPPAAMHRESVFGGAAAASARLDPSKEPDRYKIKQREVKLDVVRNTQPYENYLDQVPRHQPAIPLPSSKLTTWLPPTRLSGGSRHASSTPG